MCERWRKEEQEQRTAPHRALASLDAHGIAWRNYHSDLPSVAILIKYAQRNTNKLLPTARFFADVAAGTLPAVSVVDPAFNGGGSEENPDDIRVGEQFAARVINAVMAGPGWSKTWASRWPRCGIK